MLVPIDNPKDIKGVINAWKEVMVPRMREWFGIYSSCLSNGVAKDWMDSNATYPDTSPPPNKTTHYVAYRSYTENVDVWYGYRSDYQLRKGTMTTVLFEGCLSKASQMRMREHEREEVESLLESGDLLAMYKLIIKVHSYTGVTTKRDDDLRVRMEFVEFMKEGLHPGDTLTQYKLRFDLLEQKLRDFELSGSYSDEDRMTIFLTPLKSFPNIHVSKQVIDWLSGDSDRPLPDSVLSAYKRLKTKYETSTDVADRRRSDKGARVHTMKISFDGQELDVEGHVETDEDGNSRIVTADGAVFTALASVKLTTKAICCHMPGPMRSSNTWSRNPKPPSKVHITNMAVSKAKSQ